MEYTFGTNSQTGREVLKTKGDGFTDLSGWQETVQEYPDCTRTDRFLVLRKIGQDTDSDGSHYTWYEICNHNIITDKTPMLAARMDYLAMMAGVDMPEEGANSNGTQPEV